MIFHENKLFSPMCVGWGGLERFFSSYLFFFFLLPVKSKSSTSTKQTNSFQAFCFLTENIVSVATFCFQIQNTVSEATSFWIGFVAQNFASENQARSKRGAVGAAAPSA